VPLRERYHADILDGDEFDVVMNNDVIDEEELHQGRILQAGPVWQFQDSATRRRSDPSIHQDTKVQGRRKSPSRLHTGIGVGV
jgi:hypothetical protein